MDVHADTGQRLPELGLGDDFAAQRLVPAQRAVLRAESVEEVVAAVAGFVRAVGGEVIDARLDAGRALPMDLSFATSAPLLADADPVSPARMRLEQLLPTLMDDARVAVARLQHLQQLGEAAAVDPLTGLASRRRLFRALAAARPGDVLAVVDVDRFKVVNDTDGHRAGDAVLAALGRLLGSLARGGDCVGRYGGDELVLVMSQVPVDVVVTRIETARQAWRSARPIDVTFSAGVARVDGRGWLPAMERADEALYAAKRAGRNTTVAAGDGDRAR